MLLELRCINLHLQQCHQLEQARGTDFTLKFQYWFLFYTSFLPDFIPIPNLIHFPSYNRRIAELPLYRLVAPTGAILFCGTLHATLAG